MASYSRTAHPTRASVVTADGTRLAARITGPADAELTVVLLHGHCQDSSVWDRVADMLSAHARVLTYDHRGHGESAPATLADCTLEQLADDLATVLDQLAPAGRIVLAGHSMGGMTALTYVAAHVEQLGARIAGVALIATAAGRLAEAGLGRMLRHPLVSRFHGAVARAPRTMAFVKRVGSRTVAGMIARRNPRTVEPRVAAMADALRNNTSVTTMAGFLPAFARYDRTAALPALAAVPTVVLCGTEDQMTPPSHSMAMAAAIPGSELIFLPETGHSIVLERPTAVASSLVGLLHSMAPAVAA